MGRKSQPLVSNISTQLVLNLAGFSVASPTPTPGPLAEAEIAEEPCQTPGGALAREELLSADRKRRPMVETQVANTCCIENRH